jgi:hypothetical protein
MKTLMLSAALTLAIAPFSSIAYGSPFVGGQLNIANRSAQTKIAQTPAANNSSDSARILVQCGPGGAVRIETKVPPGCRALPVNSPPAGK